MLKDKAVQVQYGLTSDGVIGKDPSKLKKYLKFNQMEH
jgi:murein L,D-transpeptidase YcbB/YkuD